MLIEFRVENYRSLRTEQVLSLEAAKLGDPADVRLRRVDGSKAALLPVAALYGANGSGKSSVLEALGFMWEAVGFSQRAWGEEEGIPRTPFAWGASREAPTTCEAVFVLEGARYQYGFVVDDEAVLEEWLFAWPKGRRQTWFEREGETFKFGDKLQGENETLARVTRPGALFLSVADMHGHGQLSPLARWFGRLFPYNIPLSVSSWSATRWHARWVGQHLVGVAPEAGAESPETLRRDMLLQMIRELDLGIDDLRVEREEVPSAAHPKGVKGLLKVSFHHRAADGGGWLPLVEESEGTSTFFDLAPAMIETLLLGGVLLVDELESSLHPKVAGEIVKLFNDPQFNPHNAQLIFTTHDTHLLGTALGEPLLRRDQIWLTEKSAEGETSLYPLTDYRPRKGENIERGYLQGRYGAIPYLGMLPRVEG